MHKYQEGKLFASSLHASKENLPELSIPTIKKSLDKFPCGMMLWERTAQLGFFQIEGVPLCEKPRTSRFCEKREVTQEGSGAGGEI